MRTMQDQFPPEAGALAGLLAKLLPAGIGAAIMILVESPATKRELFGRAFVAFGATYLFGDILFDYLYTTATFAFLMDGKRAHHVAVDGFVGAVGWFVAGAAGMLLRSLKQDPLKLVRQVRGLFKVTP